jgi:hypothetical protein
VLFGDLVEGGIVDISIVDDKPTFSVTPMPKPLTKAEKKALKQKAKEENAEVANAQEN